MSSTLTFVASGRKWAGHGCATTPLKWPSLPRQIYPIYDQKDEALQRKAQYQEHGMLFRNTPSSSIHSNAVGGKSAGRQ